MCGMRENGFWKVCEALDCERRISLIRFLIEVETTEFLSVSELAEKFETGESGMSVHLKKLASAGLVSSKRADRRVYYRAFPTTPEADRVLAALRAFFAMRPDATRIRDLIGYVHALSHHRRNAIVRCLFATPNLSLKELSQKTDMPLPTADRLWGELNKVHIVDLNGTVVPPETNPESTFLELTVEGADSHL